MYPGYHGQDGLGRGDINGLQRLHDVPLHLVILTRAYP